MTVRTGATKRYDIGLFVATDGGSALSGNSCYHDFVQPASAVGPWDLYSGNPLTQLFKELEGNKGDACGDVASADGDILYTFQQQVTILCTDANNDGVVDPISTGVSWDNNAGTTCNNVKGAVPGTGSKCRVESVVPGVIIYRGYDWGDLPVAYQTLLANDGARHAIQDANNDGAPDSRWIGSTEVPAVWLGTLVDYSPNGETNGLPDPYAAGDDAANLDDEDGITVPSPWNPAQGDGQFQVVVNSSNGTCAGCKLGFWIDWNKDGDFADAGESYLKDVIFGANLVSFAFPGGQISAPIFARFRLYDGRYAGSYEPSGLVVNGEVEDYYFETPLYANIVSFTATGAKKAITLNWTTDSEISNLGFNLYRATSLKAKKSKLNDALISSKAPGSGSSASYTYVDKVNAARVYYYWLEDVDMSGNATLHGPVEARAK